VVIHADRDQNDMKKQPDIFEKLLTGRMTVRRFCSEIGFSDLANQRKRQP
jgi:hypothetical protein